ncbi:LysE family translocator [Vibrio sonorensis]|uniref:LysE family translocator n=1 Tax=Vibrio sonorensis TaxID=1004316 RepID=UPI0008DA68D6|nr:LysE family translocator [Vibrio sonorensis]
MSLEFLLMFTFTVFIISIIPGPNMILALTHGMFFGVKRTLASAMGNTVVTLVQASISVIGLGAVLVASETLFAAVKWAGAAYLFYLGITFLLSKQTLADANAVAQNREQTSLKRMFMQSALIAAGNPKAIIFFTAVMPQFMDPTQNVYAQSIALTLICGLSAFSSFMLYAVGGQKLVGLFSKARWSKAFNRVIGTTFIGSGVALAISSR